MSLIKSYLMLQNAKYKAFIISKLLRKNQQGGQKYPHPQSFAKYIWNLLGFTEDLDLK